MIAKKYQLFDAKIVTSARFIATQWQRLRLDETLKDNYVNGFSQWTYVYYEYLDANTRTNAIAKQLAKLHDDLNRQLNAIIQQVKHDANLTLTAQDKSALGIKS